MPSRRIDQLRIAARREANTLNPTFQRPQSVLPIRYTCIEEHPHVRQQNENKKGKIQREAIDANGNPDPGEDPEDDDDLSEGEDDKISDNRVKNKSNDSSDDEEQSINSEPGKLEGNNLASD